MVYRLISHRVMVFLALAALLSLSIATGAKCAQSERVFVDRDTLLAAAPTLQTMSISASIFDQNRDRFVQVQNGANLRRNSSYKSMSAAEWHRKKVASYICGFMGIGLLAGCGIMSFVSAVFVPMYMQHDEERDAIALVAGTVSMGLAGATLGGIGLTFKMETDDFYEGPGGSSRVSTMEHGNSAASDRPSTRPGFSVGLNFSF